MACLRRFNHIRLGVMTATQIAARGVQRVWGRLDLPGWAQGPFSAGNPIGEIWFEDGTACDAELLVKYLFTSDRLSIQVHPADETAQALGYPRGKDEAWFVLEAKPGAVIGLGLREPVSRDTLRGAALDGSIEALIDWRPVHAGDFFYSPAGTVHAIGAGLSIVEIQQNLDLTYRLYDYGRPRELHLDAGVAVADPGPWHRPFEATEAWPGRTILAAGGAFVVEHWRFAGQATLSAPDSELLLTTLSTKGWLDGQALSEGSVWRVEGRAALTSAAPVDILATYPGAETRDRIVTRR